MRVEVHMSKRKIFVGTDTSQRLAVKVLEHSIKKYASEDVEVVAMCNLPVPVPQSKTNQQRTGFSFSRFCIPQFMDYKGTAIYLDADMLVFSDIMELFRWPMKDHHIVIQKPVPGKKRIRQCSVMVIDCEKCRWDIKEIVADLDNGKYNYQQLMQNMCIVDDAKVGEELPFSWNSLEHYDNDTKLIHYTDMNTQPWVSARNKHAGVWYEAVLEMLNSGKLTEDEIRAEISAGYFRPSLLVDLHNYAKVPKILAPFWRFSLALMDVSKGYRKHKEVMTRSNQIKKAMAVKT